MALSHAAHPWCPAGPSPAGVVNATAAKIVYGNPKIYTEDGGAICKPRLHFLVLSPPLADGASTALSHLPVHSSCVHCRAAPAQHP